MRVNSAPPRSRPSAPILRLVVFFGLAYDLPAAAAATTSLPSGSGASSDETKNACICDSDADERERVRRRDLQEDRLQFLGLFDTESLYYGEEIFDYTMKMINNHTDGWHDEILNDGTVLEWNVRNASCDGTVASKAYWDDRTDRGGIPPHGIVGCMCSGASIAVTRIAGLEGVPQVSQASTSAELSDNIRFPYFARTVSPDESAAIVAALRGFGWARVTIISTDTPYARGLSTSVQRLWTGKHNDSTGKWEGEVAYSPVIVINQDRSINEESVLQALEGVPTDNPTINSRVILLISHEYHAFDVLRIAKKMNFQPDSIWVGCPAWSATYPPDGDMTQVPWGAIGITPYRNRNPAYFEFMTRLQEAQSRDGKTPWNELPEYQAEHLVDSILALTMSLSSIEKQDRRNGSLVMSHLLKQNFDGISGNVRFTPEGDRQDPIFSIVNLKSSTSNERVLAWDNVGSVSHNGFKEMSLDKICFAGVGCSVGVVPNDSYPVPPSKVPAWVIGTITTIAVVLLCVTLSYCYVAQKRKQVQSQMSEMQKKIAAMKNIDNELIDANQVVEDAKQRMASLVMKRAALQETPKTWSDSLETLVSVPSDDAQYWSVLEKMRETIPDAHISSLWRVQNSSLWSYYSFHKDRLESNNVEVNERRVWHGTSTLDPSLVYDDQFDGFMMQFAAHGLWGRGIYFADKASYSVHYSHSPAGSMDKRPGVENGDKEMFLARLIVGKDASLKQNRSLTVPPTDPITGRKFNSVTGHTAGSQVWIVYENGRAYPEYLVRYYTGDRNKKRTPYKSKNEARKSTSWKEAAFDLEGASSTIDLEGASSISDVKPRQIRQGLWEYLSDFGWVAYDGINHGMAQQTLIENAYQDFSRNATSSNTVSIRGPEWEYKIDIQTMTQTNVQHPGGKNRKIRFHSS